MHKLNSSIENSEIDSFIQLKPASQNLAIYVHWPFCKSKCPYCDFNSHTFDSINHDAWLEGYKKELDYFKDIIKNKKITSIFFGGGTPSLMKPHVVEGIIKHIQIYGADIDHQTEITLEANPTSVESKKFADFRAVGINRLSIGIQALNDEDLKFLGRNHNAKESIHAIELAAKYFDNYSFDLIYARPKQTLMQWKKELEFALRLASKHISLYQLTIEKGTKFFSMHNKGLFSIPNEEKAVALYDLTNEILEKNGLYKYEISNYAKPQFESKHNLTYWRYESYLGIGPGAHSRILSMQSNNTIEEPAKKPTDIKVAAIEMIYSPTNWQNNIFTYGNAIKSFEILAQNIASQEALMMGLRLAEGVECKKLDAFRGVSINESLIRSLEDEGLISTITPNFLKLTEKGLKLHSQVLMYIYS